MAPRGTIFVTKKRRSHSPEFKFRAALEAVKGMKPIAQIAQEKWVHPSLVRAGKKQLHEDGPELFRKENPRAEKEQQ